MVSPTRTSKAEPLNTNTSSPDYKTLGEAGPLSNFRLSNSCIYRTIYNACLLPSSGRPPLPLESQHQLPSTFFRPPFSKPIAQIPQAHDFIKRMGVTDPEEVFIVVVDAGVFCGVIG